jgi:hypothetical protein
LILSYSAVTNRASGCTAASLFHKGPVNPVRVCCGLMDHPLPMRPQLCCPGAIAGADQAALGVGVVLCVTNSAAKRVS